MVDGFLGVVGFLGYERRVFFFDDDLLDNLFFVGDTRTHVMQYAGMGQNDLVLILILNAQGADPGIVPEGEQGDIPGRQDAPLGISLPDDAGDDNPAVNVSWFDAVLYLNWVNKQFKCQKTAQFKI